MTVYVDDMRARYGRMLMSHMVADSDQELRQMARRIGVAQRWHQGDHFDVCQSKRALAIERGAVPITQRQLAKMDLLYRERGGKGALPTPAEAEAWWRGRENAKGAG